MEEARKRADELVEVVELREGDECPAEGGVVEVGALGAAVLGPECGQTRRLLLWMPPIGRGLAAVTLTSGTVLCREVGEVRENGREWRLVRAIIIEDG